MTQKQIAQILRSILKKEDINTDIVNRKFTTIDEEISVLLAHVSLLVTDLRFDSSACRRELTAIKKILEESNGDIR